MSSPAPKMGKLAMARERRIVELVLTNEVKFVKFEKPEFGKHVTLGVRGLSACSVVILASDYAAILAHVGPNIPGSSEKDAQSFLRLANDKVSELEDFYRKNPRYFGPDSHAYLIWATVDGNARSPDQVKIYRNRLMKLGVPLVSDGSYETSPPTSINDNGPAGTVWVVKDANERPTVWFEDNRVKANPQLLPPPPNQQLRPTPNPQLMTAYPAQARPAQTGTSAFLSPEAANVREPTSQQPAESYWAKPHGGAYYLLFDKSRNVLQQSIEPPRGVPIRLLSQNGAYISTAIFDGQGWKNL